MSLRSAGCPKASGTEYAVERGTIAAASSPAPTRPTAEQSGGKMAGERTECERGVARVVDRDAAGVQGRGAGDDDEERR